MCQTCTGLNTVTDNEPPQFVCPEGKPSSAKPGRHVPTSGPPRGNHRDTGVKRREGPSDILGSETLGEVAVILGQAALGRCAILNA